MPPVLPMRRRPRPYVKCKGERTRLETLATIKAYATGGIGSAFHGAGGGSRREEGLKLAGWR